MTARQKFQTRTINLCGTMQRDAAMALLPNLPIDPDRPLEIVIREKPKVRGMDANALMWVGPLADIAEQAWVKVDGESRRFSAECWHEYFKGEFLPEENDPEISELAKEGYRKWEIAPDGSHKMVGSTTQLLKRGFALYLMQVEAYGANLGVMFHAAPDRRAA